MKLADSYFNHILNTINFELDGTALSAAVNQWTLKRHKIQRRGNLSQSGCHEHKMSTASTTLWCKFWKSILLLTRKRKAKKIKMEGWDVKLNEQVGHSRCDTNGKYIVSDSSLHLATETKMSSDPRFQCHFLNASFWVGSFHVRIASVENRTNPLVVQTDVVFTQVIFCSLQADCFIVYSSQVVWWSPRGSVSEKDAIATRSDIEPACE